MRQQQEQHMLLSSILPATTPTILATTSLPRGVPTRRGIHSAAPRFCTAPGIDVRAAEGRRSSGSSRGGRLTPPVTAG